MILSKCAISGSRNLNLLKNKKQMELFSILGIKTPLSKIPILGDVLF